MKQGSLHASIGLMRFWKKPSKMLLLVVALVALLGLLATLQYRWLGQVSNGERERMRASLRAGAMRFGQDFNREITRAFLSFQIDADTLQERNWTEYAQRYEHWTTSAPFPKLVSNVYLLEKGERDSTRLNRFNPSEKKFENAEWPAELAGLRPRLEAGFSQHSREQQALTEISLNPIDPNVPAIISPIVAAPRIFVTEKTGIRIGNKEELPPPFTDIPPFAGYLIVELDREVIKRELIPALVQRYFSGSDGLEYNLSVINRKEPEKPVYQSTQTPAQASNADASASLLDIEPEQLDALFFGLPRRRSPIADKQSSTVFTRKVPPEKIILRSTEKRQSGSEQNENVAIETSQTESTSSRSITIHLNNEQNENGMMVKTAEGGAWQLLIQHRAGSLDTAVTNARRRNLAISFGILLLLASSVALIVVSTKRAERLAHRQMEFVSAVSHEFRTPLAVICSAGENLADGIVDAPQQIEKYGALIRNEGRRLTEMVEQVLEFAGARSGRRSYQLHPVEINSLIENALASCQPLITEKDFVVEKKIELDLPQVKADAAALRSSLQNLLSNAMKYDGGKRWIGISAKRVANGHGEEVQITVADRGIGIAPEELPHVFEPFYRGREVVAAQIHGNGLGLSLVKQVVEAHQGRVSVVSSPQQGSAFTLHLPAYQTAAEGGARHPV